MSDTFEVYLFMCYSSSALVKLPNNANNFHAIVVSKSIRILICCICIVCGTTSSTTQDFILLLFVLPFKYLPKFFFKGLYNIRVVLLYFPLTRFSNCLCVVSYPNALKCIIYSLLHYMALSSFVTFSFFLYQFSSFSFLLSNKTLYWTSEINI